MKYLIFIILCVIILGGGYFVFHLPHSKVEYSGQELVEQFKKKFREAPQFELADVAGKKVRLQDFKGNVVVLHFWASWCAPCVEEISKWVELSGKFKKEPIQFIAISLDTSWKDAQRMIPHEGSKMDLAQQGGRRVVSLLDLSAKIPEDYGTYQFPETYLISPDLKILFKWVGPQNWNEPETLGVIEKVVESYSRNS